MDKFEGKEPPFQFGKVNTLEPEILEHPTPKPAVDVLPPAPRLEVHIEVMPPLVRATEPQRTFDDTPARAVMSSPLWQPTEASKKLNRIVEMIYTLSPADIREAINHQPTLYSVVRDAVAKMQEAIMPEERPKTITVNMN